MLVFQDSEMRYHFDFRSRVRYSRGRCKGVIVFETDLTLESFKDWGDRGLYKFVPVLGGNGTK